MKTIVLTGMSGSGKSTVGKLLSEELNSKFVDIDEQITLKENKSINEIFAQNGEQYFRKLEVQIISELFENKNLIISLGGGAFENEQTRNFLLKNSIVFYLKTSEKIIYERLKNTSDRPLLINMTLERIKSLLNLRKNNYELAHFTILTDNKSTEEIGSEIINKCANLK